LRKAAAICRLMPDSSPDAALVALAALRGSLLKNQPIGAVVKAITAVSGKLENGQIVELIRKIKFTPPKKG
jgi:hypothetical protein